MIGGEVFLEKFISFQKDVLVKSNYWGQLEQFTNFSVSFYKIGSFF